MNQGETRPVRTKTGKHCYADCPSCTALNRRLNVKTTVNVLIFGGQLSSRRKAMTPPLEQRHRTCQIYLGVCVFFHLLVCTTNDGAKQHIIQQQLHSHAHENDVPYHSNMFESVPSHICKRKLSITTLQPVISSRG